MNSHNDDYEEHFEESSIFDGLDDRELLFVATGFLCFLAWYLLFRVVRVFGEDESPAQFSVPVPEQCAPDWQGEELEDPRIKVSGSSVIQCYSPATGQYLGQVNPVTPDGIDRAIAKAQEAQESWAKTTWSQRRKVLQTLLKFILNNQDTIATVACLDSGKTKVDASLGEILTTTEKLRWTIKHGETALQLSSRPSTFLLMYKKNEVSYEPLGVVAACVSWNYPFHNFIGPVISALFSGNAIIVKASERTAWSTQYFTLLVRNALSACGHDPHLVTSLLMWPNTANYLTAHPGIAHLTFIGSRAVAHHVCASAATSLTPVCAELGGKDPAIVLDKVANLEKIASILMRGTFQSAGQNCVGIERIIALPLSYERLVKILEPKVKSLRVGSALNEEDVDIGATIMAESFDRLEKLIQDAVNHGARLLVGGRRYINPKYPKGHYFSPTLIVDVSPTMRIAQEELFAPVCLLMRVETVDQAIVLANSTMYALGASVFGSDPKETDQVVKGVRAGQISVNDFAVYYLCNLPFGGLRGSGYGRFGGEEGLRSLCNAKSCTKDRFSFLSTSIPPVTDYPIKSTKRAWEFCKGIVWTASGVGVAQKGKGIGNIIKNS